MMRRGIISLSCLLCLMGKLGYSQTARFELGQRLRHFEQVWDKKVTEDGAARAVAPLKKATVSFFTFRLTEAGRQLDLARLALEKGKPASGTLWATSLSLVPNKRLVDGNAQSLSVTLKPFYSPTETKPKKAQARIWLSDSGGKKWAVTEQEIGALPWTGQLKWKRIPEGDHDLHFEIRQGARPLCSRSQKISVVKDLQSRLKKGDEGLGEIEKTKWMLEFRTASRLLQILGQLAKGQTLETDYPAARLLSEVEQVVMALKNNKPFYTAARAGQFWLRLPTENGIGTLRIQVPETAAAGKKMPLVIALHGAGGSENMFFDGYGDGAIARMCQKRKWLLVAPQSGLKSGTLEALTERYPIDRSRVFLVGHSMGAAQAMRLVSRNPEDYRGVAALGGGGTAKISPALKKVGFFVGIGREDFARGGARVLHQRLQKGGVKDLIFREHPHIEHLVIVQKCLPEVFQFFDRLARAK